MFFKNPQQGHIYEVGSSLNLLSLLLQTKDCFLKLSDISSNPEIVMIIFLNNNHEKLKSESSKNSRKPGLLG